MANFTDLFANYDRTAFKIRLYTSKSEKAKKLGKALYRCWKSSEKDEQNVRMLVVLFKLIEILEDECIQDLMHHCIFGRSEMAEKIRLVLEAFTEQKKIKAVDTMINRLLEPIIWRGLKALNGQVRYNAVQLFLLVFPLRNNNAKALDNKKLLFEQTVIFELILNDEVPIIRSTSVQGICKLFTLYWDIIPVPDLKKVFTHLTKVMAYDSSSAEVRSSVFSGLSLVLENSSSHAVLEKILPSLSVCIHDISENVRWSFIQLLHNLKKSKTVLYWNVVNVDHILARLSVESSVKLKKSLVSLVFSNFYLEYLRPEQHLLRVIMLIEKNMAAARCFFYYASDLMPSLESSVELILNMLRCVYSAVKFSLNQQKEQNRSIQVGENDENVEQSENSDVTGPMEVDQISEINQVNCPTIENRLVTVENLSLIGGLFECSIVLWKGVAPKLLLAENSALYKRLTKVSGRIVQECFTFFNNEIITEILSNFATLMKPSFTPYLASQSFKKLKNAEDSDENITCGVYGSLLKAVCFWRFSEIADVILLWLDRCGDFDRTQFPTISTARRPRIKFAAPTEPSVTVPKPRLALRYLEFILNCCQCRHYILGKHKQELVRIAEKLQEFLAHYVVLNDERYAADKIGFDEILLANRLECSVRFLLTSNKGAPFNTENTVNFLGTKMCYIETAVLPLLMEQTNAHNALKFLSQFLLSCRHALLLGVCNNEFLGLLRDFLDNLMEKHSDDVAIFCEISQTCFNVVDFLCSRSENGEVDVDEFHSELVNRWCEKFFMRVECGTDILAVNKTHWKVGVEATLESLQYLKKHKSETTRQMATENFLKMQKRLERPLNGKPEINP